MDFVSAWARRVFLGGKGRSFETARFAKRVELMQKWMDSDRFADIKRPYTAAEVVQLQGPAQGLAVLNGAALLYSDGIHMKAACRDSCCLVV